MTRMSFEEAKRRFVNRYTMEHVPQWAAKPIAPGKFYAPQYRTDREWYENTIFPGDPNYRARKYCQSNNRSWPLGQFLAERFIR